MPPIPEPSPDRATLLERIIAEGDRRRHRRHAVAGGFAAVVLAAGLVVAWPGRADDGGLDVAASGGDEPTTTAATKPDRATTSTSTTDTTDPTAVDPDPGAGAGPDSETTTTTEADDGCRNSHDPACGDFYWDYDPATFVNAPMFLTMTYEPDVIVVGEPVTFTITASDSDGATFVLCNWIQTFPNITERSFDWRGDCSDSPAPCTGPDVPRHGPWDPPEPEPDAGPVTNTATIVFPQAGEYLVTTHIVSGDPCIGDAPPDDAYRFYGYTDSEETSLTVQVVAAPED